MADIDAFLDTLLQQRNAQPVAYIDDKYVDTLGLRQNLSRGQGVFAKRFLPVEESVCAFSCPTATAIDSDFLDITCYYCLIATATANHGTLPGWGYPSVQLKTCSGCHLARFCNRNCQTRAWYAYHRYECKIFRRLKDNFPPAMFRAVLRLVLLRDQGLLSGEEWTQVTSLTAHDDALAGYRSNVTEMAESIQLLAQSSMGVNMIQRLIFIMKFNAIELPTPIYGGTGVMLAPLVGKINHSCEPNVAFHRPQHTMISGWRHSAQLSRTQRDSFVQIVPLRNIQEGEEILNCYVAPTASVDARKTKLREDYFFDCNCPRCIADEEDISNLETDQPEIFAQLEQWNCKAKHHMSRMRSASGSLQKAVNHMEKSNQLLKYPTLYSTGAFPQLALRLVHEGLNSQKFDMCVVNLFRLYFLVNSRRLISRHNPTNVYTAFVMLDVLDVLLDASTVSDVSNQVKKRCLQSLSSQGIARDSLTHWRHRIADDLEDRLERSAMKDLTQLLRKRDEERIALLVHFDKVVDCDVERLEAEQQMRAVLKLTELNWKSVLQIAGC